LSGSTLRRHGVRLLKLRLSVFLLLIALVAVGLRLLVPRYSALRDEYQRRAYHHERFERLYASGSTDANLDEGYRRIGEYHAALARKYRHAAGYPFLPLGADTVPPIDPSTGQPWVWIPQTKFDR
jgi:hypothetical protein